LMLNFLTLNFEAINWEKISVKLRYCIRVTFGLGLEIKTEMEIKSSVA